MATRRARWSVGLMAVAALTGCGDQTASTGAGDAPAGVREEVGCGAPDPILEATEHVARGSRKGGIPQSGVTAEPVTDTLLSQHPFVRTLGSLPAAGVVNWTNNGQISVIYAEELPDMDPGPVVHHGGLVLEILPIPGAVWDAHAKAEQIGPAASVVDVGPYQGVVSWADEDAYGTRPHYLQWGDGPLTWRLIGIRPAEKMVALGRSLEC